MQNHNALRCGNGKFMLSTKDRVEKVEIVSFLFSKTVSQLLMIFQR